MKIGVYGGTFNPFHLGHLAVAEAAKRACNLDQVWIIPAGDPYMKDKTDLASGEIRIRMIQETLNDFNIYWGRALDIEVKRDKPSYTIDTMHELTTCWPDNEYYLIMGRDAFDAIDTWKDGNILREKYHFIVVNRNEKIIFNPNARVYYISNFNSSISSTNIRKAVKNQEPFQAYVSPRVYSIITRNRLYRDNSYKTYMQNFDANAHAEYLIKWIRKKMDHFGSHSKCVIGISGGKDSSVIAALCKAALGPDRIYGVLMPNGKQKDINDSYQVIKHLGIKSTTINIGPTINTLLEDMTWSMECDASTDALINLPARIRMSTLYLVAQTLGNAYVVNTCNLSEDYVGYSTWHGDSAGDFSPLAEYTSDEVIAIGDALGLPYNLTHKTPSDGLCGQTDEDKLGFTYETLNAYIRCNINPPQDIKNKIDTMHVKNKFKLLPLDKPEFPEDLVMTMLNTRSIS